jgi:hypothetical protein
MSLSTTRLHSRGDKMPTLQAALGYRPLQSFSCKCGCEYPVTQHGADSPTDCVSRPMPLVSVYYNVKLGTMKSSLNIQEV